MLERLRYLVAIELLVRSTGGRSARGSPSHALGTGARQHYARVREIVPMLDDDRPLGPDVEAVATAVAGGSFAATRRHDVVPAQLGPGAVALGQHVTIVLTALAIAFAIALPVGIVAARRERVYAFAITVAGFLYTIPTLAFLALLIPLVGLGRTNAIIAMVAFSLLILIRNVATGIRGVAPDVVDAARGMGMSARQVLLRIELPLASPVIVAGLRVAAVTVISVTVVAAYVNAGGLGTLIFNGIASDHAPKIWAGALTACALAIAVDGTLALARAAPRAEPRRMRRMLERSLAIPARASGAVRRSARRARRAVGRCAGDRGRASRSRRASTQRIGPRAAFAAINVANVGRTLPSLAVLALVMPLLGTGFAPSLFALTLLALPPILINTLAGMRGIDPEIVDAARGMGMTRAEILAKIEWPLALPVIFAGLRTAAIQVISGAVLAAFIGGGGLGDFITAGHRDDGRAATARRRDPGHAAVARRRLRVRRAAAPASHRADCGAARPVIDIEHLSSDSPDRHAGRRRPVAVDR